jgi:signal transduction histidine kinase
LCAILALFSIASYVQYRRAAWRAFAQDLQANLNTLQTALLDEIGEEFKVEPNTASAVPAHPYAMDALKRAAGETVVAFRLTGLYAEIRHGLAGETSLARIDGAGVGPGESLLAESVWRQTAGSAETQFLSAGTGRRALVRRFTPPGETEPFVLAVGDRTALVDQTLGSIRRFLIGIGMAGLLLALIGGYWLATRALRPIDTLTRQAGRMAAVASIAGVHRLEVSSLDDELGRLASTFNQLLARIESSVTQMRTFVADAAHELKTPVSIVRTEAELSLSSARGPETYREALEAIAGESSHLSRLVSDLTLLAEGETLDHPLERRLVDLNELAHEVMRSLRSVAASRQVTLKIDASGRTDFRGDERLLRQILTNLVENAIKFSPASSQIAIALSSENGARRLRVIDEAPTLSDADRSRIFERFFRSQAARSSGATGSGLGLAIASWAAKLHGGRVYVEPRETSGNAFVVELPLVEESAGTP